MITVIPSGLGISDSMIVRHSRKTTRHETYSEHFAFKKTNSQTYEIFNSYVRKGLAIQAPIQKSTCRRFLQLLSHFQLPVLSNIIEKVVTTKLQQLVTSAFILDVSVRVRPGHNTDTALVALNDIWIVTMGIGEISMLILQDFSTAFCTVDNKVLLTCLHDTAEVDGPALQSSPAKFRVVRGNCFSSLKALTCRVPQEYRLSLLFSIQMRLLGREETQWSQLPTVC